MDFQFSAEQEQFREEVRDFLRKELTAEFRRGLLLRSPEDQEYSPEFSSRLASKGWLGIGWPGEYGGQGRSFTDQLVCAEEIAYQRAPILYHFWAVDLAGPVLIGVGSEELKREYVPRILGAEINFCIGFTEPEAGSDLASLQTRAVADGDHYVINGQKIFISLAHKADYCLLAARTDLDAPKHRGISLFVMDMKAPGVTVNPAPTMGDMYASTVFLDNVRVRQSDLVGEPNRGWYHLAICLDHERIFVGALVARRRRMFDELVGHVRETRRNGRPLGQDPQVRHILAELAIELNVARLLSYRTAWVLEQGRVPFAEASMTKVHTSELDQRLTNFGIGILGLHGLLKQGSQWTPFEGRVEQAYRVAILESIGGGTNEIQRSIIAMMGLGMPRN
jgi:alkylation response protein AidB-like acyl-CoA dehydrogenase